MFTPHEVHLAGVGRAAPLALARHRQREKKRIKCLSNESRLPLAAAAETTESAIGAFSFRSVGGQRSSPVSFCVIPFYM